MKRNAVFDSNEANSGSVMRGKVHNVDEERRRGTKRSKYTAKACRNCKRRKVKCSGEDICQQCRNRDVRCCYSPPFKSLRGKQNEKERSTPSHGNSIQSVISPVPDIVPSPSVWIPAISADPRVEELCARVGALERMLTHLVKVAKGTEVSSPSTIFQSSVRASAHRGGDDTDQFTTRVMAHCDLSLSSHVAAMSALFSSSLSTNPGSNKLKDNVEALFEFPEPSRLQYLLDVYFRDMAAYFPFLDRQQTEKSIHNVIYRLGYGVYNRILVVTADDLSVIALACIMMAMAECVDSGEGVCDGDARPGGTNYLQSCRAMQCFINSETPDLNIVRAQCLIVIYLMHCESLRPASEAMSVTWRSATSICLNNKNVWPKGDLLETLQRQKLWWTVYFLDRQVSRRSGLAYHIRDTEFDVEDFLTNQNLTEGCSTQENEWDSSTTRSYLQALINLARLWGQVWDTFFAVGATKKGDWMEVEIMDARILNTRRQLPRVLTWDLENLANYTLSGEDEPHIRRRLHLFTRFELLRMLIRQNPVRPTDFNSETAHLCAQLSRKVVRAHDRFISQFPEARATGYFTTCSIVECIYHLAPMMHYSEDDNEQQACVSAFDQAHSILVRLSAYNNVAKRALKALNGVVQKWSRGNTSSNSGGIFHGIRHAEGIDFNAMTMASQVYESQEVNEQYRIESLNANLDEWMNVSMDSLYNNDFDPQSDTQI